MIDEYVDVSLSVFQVFNSVLMKKADWLRALLNFSGMHFNLLLQGCLGLCVSFMLKRSL